MPGSKSRSGGGGRSRMGSPMGSRGRAPSPPRKPPAPPRRMGNPLGNKNRPTTATAPPPHGTTSGTARPTSSSSTMHTPPRGTPAPSSSVPTTARPTTQQSGPHPHPQQQGYHPPPPGYPVAPQRGMTPMMGGNPMGMGMPGAMAPGGGMLRNIATTAAGSMLGFMAADTVMNAFRGNSPEQREQQQQIAEVARSSPCAVQFDAFEKCVAANNNNVVPCQWAFDMFQSCMNPQGQQQYQQ